MNLRAFSNLPISSTLLALLLAAALFILGGILRPGFASFDQGMNIVRLAAFLGIIAAGQTLVIISGGEGIDLSAGAIVTLGAILVFRIVDGQNSMVLPGLAVALAAGAAIGLINGLGVTLIGIPPLVMTLGMTGVVQGLILGITQGVLEGRAAPIMARLIARPLIFGIPGVIIFWAILGVLMWLLLQRTTYGKQLFAVGVNRETARLSGVRVKVVVTLAYTMSGLLAAFGGFMVLGFTQNVFLNLGNRYLFPSIAAVVVGGTVLAGGKGSYWGTMAGALVLTLLTSLLTAMQFSEAIQQIMLGLILLALLSIYGRQRGLRQ
ncbi:MAG TPA: ABC transporter permease [Candidatus Sulfomarinibacteraceae bacterium]|nr:ABC transporter permease [Candidatus Sulfomarinibacteraceae bacterium]